MRPVPLTRVALDIKLQFGQAYEIRPFVSPNLDCPHYQSLGDDEREIWELRLSGMRLAEITTKTGLHVSEVSRIIKTIKAKFAFMAKFWKLMQSDPILKQQFFCLGHCPQKKTK